MVTKNGTDDGHQQSKFHKQESFIYWFIIQIRFFYLIDGTNYPYVNLKHGGKMLQIMVLNVTETGPGQGTSVNMPSGCDKLQ
jgi:hypothetical protein